MADYDIIIIGSGAAGEYAASYAAGDGRKVALVEKDRVGGSCVFTACIPTKAMIEAARAYKAARRADHYGLPALREMADYSSVKAWKDRLIAGIGAGRDERMEKRGVEVVKGTARFLSAGEIAVGDIRFRAANFIIATGSEPAAPPVPGLEEAGYLTNATALQLDCVPERLAVIGGGPVGVEFTQIFSAFGAVVTIIEMADRIVSGEDEDISRALTDSLAGQGVKISTGAKLTGVERSADGRILTLEDREGEKKTLECDAILLAAGRKPVMKELDLEAAGVKTYRKGIEVDAFLRTSVPHIRAVGDVNGTSYFTYVANAQGETAALDATTSKLHELRYDILPRATFCDPEIGSVGLTEAQAKERGYKVATGRFDYADLTRPIITGETGSFIKIVAEASSGKILGGHIIGSDASALIHEIAAAMKGNLTAVDIGDVLHAYPTLSEGVRYACEAVG